MVTAQQSPAPGARPQPAATRHAELLPLVVVNRREAAREAVTLWLSSPGGSGAPAPYMPGQFITLAFPTPRSTLYRSYSLCGSGEPDLPWEITVKRRHAGAVSSYLYTHVRPGMALFASPPRGSFVLPQRMAPGTALIFVAAGSGIAPIYGMLRSLGRLPAAARPRVQLHYAASGQADVIYGHELLALDPAHTWLTQFYYLGTRGERFSPARALAAAGTAAPRALWYVCGPDSLKRGMYDVLMRAGVTSAQIRSEVFGDDPAASRSRAIAVGATGAVVGRLRLADTGAALDVRAGETVLGALERQGYRPDASCRVGECGVCRLRLLAGSVRDPGAGLTPQERAAGYVLACVAEPAGDVTLASAGGSDTGAGAGRQPAVRTLRLALAASAAGLFIGVAQLTGSRPAVPPLPNITLPSVGGAQSTPSDSGTSGIATPTPFQLPPPNTSSGVS